MKICSIVLSVSLCLFNQALAGDDKLDKSGRIIGMGGAFTGLANSSYAIFYNPAGLALLPFREASAFVAQPYGLSELLHVTISYADPMSLPENLGAFGIAARRFGFQLYNETAFSIAYANSFERKFFYGATLRYHNTSIQNYGSAGAFGIDIGLLFLITPELSIGFSATNLNRPTIGISNEVLAQTYTAGASYRLFKNLRAVVDFEKDVRFPLTVKSGVEFDAVQYLSLRAGFSTEPQRLTGGVGIHYALADIDYAVTTHPDLGLSHQLSLTIRFGGATPDNPQADLDRVIDEAFDIKPPIAEGEKININTAGVQEFIRLPKINRALAERIVRYRQEYGKFESIDDVKKVRGLSEMIFQQIERFLSLDAN